MLLLILTSAAALLSKQQIIKTSKTVFSVDALVTANNKSVTHWNVQVCHSNVRHHCVSICAWFCVCIHFPYFRTPPMTAYHICRYSDAAPLFCLLFSPWTSSLIEHKLNNWLPTPFLPVMNGLSWHFLRLYYRCTIYSVLWLIPNTKVFIWLDQN